ncbi:MAG TPA: ACP phosphodiesterase [Candidatus Omnitrophica bacterium]|nr:ACP phosphodiesterase [Candidatus Omnitrophota bacterium]
MKKLLHIIATPRGDDSRTLKVSQAFLEALSKKNPDCKIDELNVATDTLPSLTLKMIDGKYVLLGGKELNEKQKEAWNPIERHIERFLSADGYLISTPMWNFGIPYPLKQYIDLIIQPKYLFRYTEKGVEGLVKNRKMTVITSRGGDYSPESPFRAYDFEEPYLRAIFGFVGITDITFMNAQPMDAMGPEIQNEKIEEAKGLARKTADTL